MRYKTDSNAVSSSKGEVLANSITHGVGIGLSIAGIVILIIAGAWLLVSQLTKKEKGDK